MMTRLGLPPFFDPSYLLDFDLTLAKTSHKSWEVTLWLSPIYAQFWFLYPEQLFIFWVLLLLFCYVAGVLMGLAVYNSIILDLHFPSICYRKLLSPPVVPPLDSAAVGVTRDPTIDDLAEIMPVSLLKKKICGLNSFEGTLRMAQS